jgi:chemotaxis methyl-accepting protein methylase/signal transduction histidine kinase
MARRGASPAAKAPRVFPVVGIGASAGGLDAFKKFFSAMPAAPDMAFVLIQHLDPTRESLTASLLDANTPMRVEQVQEGMVVEANRVYVIPPNSYMDIRAGVLRLSPPSAPRSLRMAVDFFLRSLAEDRQENAIGIILSGTGTDGTLGLKDIKANGGMTMVQDPETAQHDGMPRSAIASGSADYVLPAEGMAEALLAYVKHATVAASSEMGSAVTSATEPDVAADPLQETLGLLRTHAKFDFAGYKKGTLRRRMLRRMGLRHLANLSSYVEVLRRDDGEVNALFKDLLINVTSFFREPEAWQFLQEQVIRRVIAAKSPDLPVRIWVPACSTGEEAYSMAMLLAEESQAAQKPCVLQLFASDVDAEALESARAGVYPEGIAANISPERLERFFTKGEHTYRVNKELRDTVVFAQQSLVSDPPFSRLDVISCRNLFIYLEAAIQEQLLPLLHFALRDGGYLFLGSAEGIGLQEDLFEPVSSKWRIFRRVGPTRHDLVHFPVAATPATRVGRGRPVRPSSPTRLAALAQSLLLQRYAPACVIVDRDGRILYFHGRTDDYLQQPAGVPTPDLLAQARSGLRTKLRSALQDAVRSNERVVTGGVQMRRGDAFPIVRLSVEPLSGATGDSEALWLVSLQDEPIDAATAAPTDDRRTAADVALVHQLEYELKSTKEDLQQTIEDLRASNEELMSVNEEFQSSNEELETSKEELQSLNEELTTANSQLESKIGELEAANNDLDNLLTSTEIATLFLDKELRIRRFTPAATRLFSLISSDIGRPIVDIAQKFSDVNLLSDAKAALEQAVAPKTEIQGHDGRWYVRQVLPYRTRDHRSDGVVMTFSDVAAEALQEARLYAESIVDTVRDPLLVLDGELRVRSANHAFYAELNAVPDKTVGLLLSDVLDRQFDVPKLRTALGNVLRKDRVMKDFELVATFAPLGQRIMRLSARTINREGIRAPLALLAIEDFTDRVRAQEVLQERESRDHIEGQVRIRQAELAHALRISTVGELASSLAHEINQPLSAIVNGVDACARSVRSGKFARDKLLALLDEASSEALRAGSIVEHLRHFIEKGKPQFERIDLRDVVEHLPHLLGRELRHEGIELRLDLPQRPVPVHGDRIQLEQVFVNFIQNAIDAIREAPGDLREIQVAVATAKRMAEVRVRDTGIGVSSTAAPRLFEPFFTTKTRGLGMGLAISRSIIEAHRGKVWLKARADGARGTSVCFSIPLLQAPRTSRKKAPATRAGGRKRV